MPKPLDITGMRFGRLVAIKLAWRTAERKSIWRCQCDCGREKEFQLSNLRSGTTQSCGCMRAETARKKQTTHGMRHTPEYRSWMMMKNRCDNPNHPQFQYWGGQGVTYDPRWASFETFYADMGPRPRGHSLDRYPDPSGDYEPSNCRWATALQQRHNRR